MDWNEYQDWVRTKARPGGNKLNMLNAALGLAGEAGEVADIVKKKIFHKHKTPSLAYELGDILFYLAWMADLDGCNLQDVMVLNVAKLNERYPDGFSTERSLNRKEGIA